MAPELLAAHGQLSSPKPAAAKAVAASEPLVQVAPSPRSTPKGGSRAAKPMPQEMEVPAAERWALMVADITASAVKIRTAKQRTSLEDESKRISSTMPAPPPAPGTMAPSTASPYSSTVVPPVPLAVATKQPNPVADTPRSRKPFMRLPLRKMLPPPYSTAKQTRKRGLRPEVINSKKRGKLLALGPAATSAAVTATYIVEKPAVMATEAAAAPAASTESPTVVAEARSVEKKVIQPMVLAPGVRFHPTEEEIVSYLKRKQMNKPVPPNAIGEIDIYKYDPWELEEFSGLKTRDKDWFFYGVLDKKFATGERLNRKTKTGFWKATGKDQEVRRDFELLGMKKVLVFYSGHTPVSRTNWVMHEYRLADSEPNKYDSPKQYNMLCRVFHKSGIRPAKDGKYAPFMEEDWEDFAGFAGDLIPRDDNKDVSTKNTQQETQPVTRELFDLNELPKEATMENSIQGQSANALNRHSPLYVAQQEVPLPLFIKKRRRQDHLGSSSYSTVMDHNSISLTAVHEPLRNDMLLSPNVAELFQNMQRQINLLSSEIEVLRLNKIANESFIYMLQTRITSALEETEEIKKRIQSASPETE